MVEFLSSASGFPPEAIKFVMVFWGVPLLWAVAMTWRRS